MVMGGCKRDNGGDDDRVAARILVRHELQGYDKENADAILIFLATIH